MTSDLPEEKKKEYKRWEGFANALLLASSVLFSGTAIAFSKGSVALFILSAACGLMTLAFTVSWFALESGTNISGRPAYLMSASVLFGLQIGFLFLALVLNAT